MKTQDKNLDWKIQTKQEIVSLKKYELLTKQNKNVCQTLNYIEHFVNLTFTVTGCISISAFASFLGISIGIRIHRILVLKISAITAGIKNYKSITKKKKKKHDKIVLLAKNKLKRIEVLIFKSLNDSYISHYEFFSVNNLLRKYNDMK